MIPTPNYPISTSVVAWTFGFHKVLDYAPSIET